MGFGGLCRNRCNDIINSQPQLHRSRGTGQFGSGFQKPGSFLPPVIGHVILIILRLSVIEL